MSFFIMRFFLYYTQSDLKQMAKFIVGWERGRGGGGVNFLGRSLEGRVEGRFFFLYYIVLRLQNTLGF